MENHYLNNAYVRYIVIVSNFPFIDFNFAKKYNSNINF